MQTFIEKVVQAELRVKNLDKVYVVPSRRAGTRLRNVLALQSQTVSFAPEIFSIEEFIAQIAGLRQASNTTQLFTLYESYLHSTPEERRESFRSFCGWAQTAIGDFNEIDRNLALPNNIFNHLKDIKDLTLHWSHNSPSALVANYVGFWQVLGAMYHHFCKSLKSMGMAHQGLLYRQAVENLEYYLQTNGDKRYVFLGFNALNNAEKALVQSILAHGLSEIYWDVESHFQEDKLHEVGLFTRRYAKQWKYYKDHDFKWVTNDYLLPKDIKSYACTSDIVQAKAVGSLLQNLSTKDLENTAIVLGDESLLLPLLNALPPTISSLNITMGIPLGQTPLASLFDALFVMKRSPTIKGYYYKDILEVFSHPLLRSILLEEVTALEEKITEENITFLTPARLGSYLENSKNIDLIAECIMLWESPRVATESCLRLIQLVRMNILAVEAFIQMEYLFGFHKIFNQVLSLLQESNYVKDIPTLIFFYREILSSETIDLKGNPDSGLQIMGVLESRVLDFENVIITSVNEGILPSGKSQNSLIPNDLKVHYELPTYFEKDAIYAYHFYRLLFRATKATFLYTTENEGLGSVEKSRFIRQLELEKIHKIKQIQAISHLTNDPKEPFCISKTPEVLEKLATLCKSGLSPSALTTYLRNPHVFYERYILGVKESNTVEETVAANTMGTIIHNTLEELYKPVIHKSLTVEVLKSAKQRIKTTVNEQFKKVYGLESLASGKNLIIYEVILRYLHNFLNLEIEKVTKGDLIIVQSIEENLINIPLLKNTFLKGKVDLVEKRNDQLNIIDYKTGKVLQRDLNLSRWEDLLLPEGKYEKAFQVLMYAYMLHKKQPLDFPIRVGIISFKNLKAGFLPFRFNKNEMVTTETLQEFEIILNQLVQEILDSQVPFKARSL